MSTFCSMPNKISSRSFSLMYGRERWTPGTLMPLWLLMTPSFCTSQIMSVPEMEVTSIEMSPSSSRMAVPGATSSCSWGQVMPTKEASPGSSPVVRVNTCPRLSCALPSLKFFRRISGPFVSRRMATGRSFSPRSALMRSMRTFCSAWLPCEKLKRATFMPFSTSASSTPSRSVAGPIVHIIFVFLMFTSDSLIPAGSGLFELLFAAWEPLIAAYLIFLFVSRLWELI